MVSRCTEHNVDMWLVSVDLRKAFDRVEQPALFNALQTHGLPNGYCKLLREIYRDQVGVLDEETRFPIARGVGQGDVLSPLLFNCAL